MSRIGSTLAGFDRAIQNNLLRSFTKLNESNLRLATLKRINKGSDDPAGLIAYEQLVSELTAVIRPRPTPPGLLRSCERLTAGCRR